VSALHFVLVATLSVQTPNVPPLNVDTTTVRHRITTTNPVAQQYFDRGLGLVFAARHSEAVEAFRTAQRIDPTCAMCYWGEALALGPSAGRAMSAADDSAAQAAISKAARHTRRVSSRERAYIRALARRYGPDAIATRAARDSAYAEALGEIVRAFPDDRDAARLLAQARLLLGSAGTPGGVRRSSARDRAAARAHSELKTVLPLELRPWAADRIVPRAKVAPRRDITCGSGTSWPANSTQTRGNS
jgi:hypothetical protein